MRVVVGVHNPPFAFLYGMREYAALGALFDAAGVAIGDAAPVSLTLGGRVAAAVPLGTAIPFRTIALRGERLVC